MRTEHSRFPHTGVTGIWIEVVKCVSMLAAVSV